MYISPYHKILMGGVLVVLIVLSFYVAPKFYPLSTFVQVINGTADATVSEIIIKYRGIRTMVALMAGACVATSGLILQFVTRNILASPGIMAMNAGGALFVSVSFALGIISTATMVSVFAIIGALLTGVLVYMVSYQLQKHHGDMVLILVGAMFATTFFGVVQLMMILDEAMLAVTLYWLFGSFNNRPFDLVLYNLGAMGLILPVLIIARHHIAILSVSDNMAKSLGANTARLRGISFLIAGVLSGIGIAIAGPIAFIGLLVPHLTRILIKSHDFKALLLPNMCIGMICALTADIISRLIMHPAEVSIGIVLSFVGGLFLLFILYRSHTQQQMRG